MVGSWHRLPIALALALAPCLPPAAAWAPETRVSMIDEAMRLMPASLRAALEHHRADVLRGMLAPMVREDDPEHRPPWAQGTLDAAVDREARGLLETLARPTPFGEIARRFGSVAHYTADAGFPPTASKADGAKRYHDFSRFCEERRERFPVVFYGHHDENLAAGDWRGFALQVMNRASRSDGELARAYAAAGDPPDPAAFDDRSVPFAVGSLSYSRTITDIVRIWLSIWEQAEGDMGRIPYWTVPETGDD
jgi:hypothetical protein